MTTFHYYHEGYDTRIPNQVKKSLPCVSRHLLCIAVSIVLDPSFSDEFLGLLASMTILGLVAVMILLHVLHPHAALVLVGGYLSPRVVVMVLRYVQWEAIPTGGYVTQCDLLLGPARRAAVTRLRPAYHAPALYRLGGIVPLALLRRD